MTQPQDVTAVVVTKGGYDISQVTNSLDQFNEVIVWDNSQRVDRKIFGRYLAALTARNEIIYIQDDDCIVAYESLLALYRKDSGKMICNVPPSRRVDYSRDTITLVGWGSIFNRSHIDAFSLYLKKYPEDELFDRECDRIFTYLVPHIEVDVPFKHLPYAFGTDRMGLEKRHGDDLHEIRKRLKTL